MEYVQGEALARLLRAVRSMMTTSDVRIIATIMSGVLHGLHAAHEAKSEQGAPLDIVHRDVSPQNILVGTDGVPRVLDFGVAKAVGRLQTTRHGQIKGKLSYMAPEQLHNQPVTRQSDIYAAAVVTWESLTGQRLFRGDNEAATVTAVLQQPVPPPSQVAAHVPLAFDRVVLRGLERDPAYRYQTAREMALDLERCAGVAPASEVGEWVESLAHDELFKRSARIAEIESISSDSSKRYGSLPAISDMPTTVTGDESFRSSVSMSMRGAAAMAPMAQERRSDVSSIAVAPILSTAPRRPRRHLPLIAGIAGVLGLAVVVGVVLLDRSHKSSDGEPAAAVGSTAGPGSAAIGPVVPPLESAVPPPDSASAAASSPPDPPTEPPPPTASTQPPARPPRPPPPPKPRPPRPAPPQADCDPPFWIDAQGHKKYKAACL
jgi:serine/threonine-protein kinase